MQGRIIQNAFHVGECLGKGAQGIVHRLERIENPTSPLAIKIFPEDSYFLCEPEQFLNEYRYASGLRHPGLLRIYEAGILWPEKRPYYISEFFDSQPLTALYSNKPDSKLFYEMVVQGLSALSYLHRSGLLHLDIKPSNILISKEPPYLVKLIDFGTVRPRTIASLKEKQSAAGTITYMSQRILSGLRPREADDLYSLGVLLYKWLEGSLPYDEWSVEDFVGQARLGVNFFRDVSFDLRDPRQEFTQCLLKNEFASAKQALDFVHRRFQEYSGTSTIDIGSTLHFPIPKINSRQKAKVSQALHAIFDSSKKKSNENRRRTILIAGPRGIGKSTFLRETVEMFALGRGIAIQVLPSVPQNSVVATIRLVSEKFDGTQAFSDLDPLATTQALISESYRRRFFSMSCRILGEIAVRLGGLILAFDSISTNDILLLEFLAALNRYIVESEVPLALVLVLDQDNVRKLESRSLAVENCYLNEILNDYSTCSIFLRQWTKPRSKKFAEQLLGESSGMQKENHAVEEVSAQNLRSPGQIREYLESRCFSHGSGIGNFRETEKRNLDFFKAVLSSLPQPVLAKTLEYFFAQDDAFRKILIDFVQDGQVIRDEERYFWNGSFAKSKFSDSNRTLLYSVAQKNEVFLIPLCMIFRQPEDYQELLEYLSRFDGTDQYLPVEAVLEQIRADWSETHPLMASVCYHLGRIQSLTGKVRKAEHSTKEALESAVRSSDDALVFLISVELANIYAKIGKHEEAIKTFRYVVNLKGLTEDQRLFVQSLSILIETIGSNLPEHLPLKQVEGNLLQINEAEYSGRLGLRYVQALLWAGHFEESSNWINRTISDLKKVNYRYCLARAYRMQARIYRFQDNLEQALLTTEESLKILKELSLPQEEIETLIQIFYLQRRCGNYDALTGYLARIYRLLPQVPNQNHELLWPELAAICQEKDQPLDAISHYRTKEKLARNYQSFHHLYIALANQAILENSLGRISRAKKAWEEAENIFTNFGNQFPLRLRKSHKDFINLGLEIR